VGIDPMMLLPRFLAVAGLILGSLCGGCRSHGRPATLPSAQQADLVLARYEYAELRMGVQARVVLYAPNEETAETAARAAFHRVAEIEDIASDYRPTSELMQLCAQAGGPPVPVSDELFFLLQRAVRRSELSHGAWDITVG